jgi:hypothetical protein
MLNFTRRPRIFLSAAAFLGLLIFGFGNPSGNPPPGPAAETQAQAGPLTRTVLADKIKGGWAGQTIGCTYGGPTEFRYKGSFIPGTQPIPWTETSIVDAYGRSPGLYDDVYMDLTFVDVFEKQGLDAPAAALAKAFAEAPYPLWHANQMARSNILRGLAPPESGHWLNNPHADDIDFQIEADFAGLMSPGMPQTAAGICDRVGHIMNYGDGWYGGLYIATMISAAFISNDIPRIVEESLRAIPDASAFARTQRDVIAGWREAPNDWQATWFKILRRWSAEVGCPDGVFSPFDIDAKINCAWVVLALLYGRGDFGRTLDIAARCGDDSDCNPASAGGILGVVLGYDRIPLEWRSGLAKVEDRPFPFVNLSLRQAYDLSLKHALAAIAARGGRVEGEAIVLPVESPRPAKLEIGFEGHFPVERRTIGVNLVNDLSFEFEGCGFALGGEALAEGADPYRFRVEMWIDGTLSETAELPTNSHDRRETLFWKYGLLPGRHRVLLRLLNPAESASVRLGDAILYANKPAPVR